DDYHIIYTQDDAKGTKGFLSSNRAGSKGRRENPSQDIWSFFLPPVVIDVVVEVLNQETNEPVANKEVKLIGSDGSNVVLNTDENGMIELGAKADGSRYVKTGVNYVIDVPSVPRVWLGNKDKFETLQVTKPTKFFRAIKILDISKPLRIPEVRYNLGEAKLQVNSECNSKDSLNYVYDIMMANPNIIVQLMSHTDSRGSAEANRKLAQRRAQSCVDYLVNEKGIAKARLVPKGFGEDQPATYKGTLLTEDYINQFKSSDPTMFEYLHQKNRRTEGEIISFDYQP
ncbi:MAG: OmpA family protein, partial [Crocinitomicaceae bacterium]